MGSRVRRAASFLAATAGFTRSELVIITLLGAGALAGAVVRLVHTPPADPPARPGMSYAALDSVFFALSSKEDRPAGRQVPAAVAGRLDLNRADATALTRLPGIGPRLAERIVQHRSVHGPFRSVDDLLSVRGIGRKTVARLRPLLTVR